MRILSLILCFTISSVGCHHRAAIITDGHKHIGVIQGHDAENIHIAAPNSSDTVVIPRTDIKAISHPGKGAIIVGSIITGNAAMGAIFGSMLTWFIYDSRDENSTPLGDETKEVLLFIFGASALAGVAGISTLIWGISTNNASHAAAGKATPKFSVTPVIQFDGNQGGLSLHFSF